eukprot:COSAG06_NODE_778_length_12377_cov_54.670875_9_plen_105_part_00
MDTQVRKCRFQQCNNTIIYQDRLGSYRRKTEEAGVFSLAGVALYPSKVYPRGSANFSTANGVPPRIDSEKASDFTDTADKVEAILTAADKHNVSVFIGLGSYAW